MNLQFDKIFPAPQKNPPARVRILRTMIVQGHGHVESGTEVLIDYDVLRMLDGSDYQMIDSGRPALEVEDPSPEREPHRPLPSRWNELPPCFAEFWELSESFRTAREHLEAIRQTRVSIFGTDLRITPDSGTILMGGAMTASARHQDGTKGVIHTLRPVDTSDPVILRQCRYLSAAESNAEDHVDALKNDKSLILQRLFLSCGAHRLEVAEELRQVLAELSEIGYALFSVRTAALGLGEWQVRRLFTGSADFERFANLGRSIDHGVSSAGLDSNGQPIRYSDLAVDVQAAYSLQMSDRLAELRPLLAEGKRELQKAKRVSAAA